MCINKQSNNICCCIYSIIAALIGAAGVAGLFLSGLIATITTLFYVTLGLGVLVLLYLILSAFCGKSSCSHIKNQCLITSAVGSVIISIFALSATITTATVPLAVLIGATAFFLFSNVFNIVNLLMRKLCNHDCED